MLGRLDESIPIMAGYSPGGISQNHLELRFAGCLYEQFLLMQEKRDYRPHIETSSVTFAILEYDIRLEFHMLYPFQRIVLSVLTGRHPPGAWSTHLTGSGLLGIQPVTDSADAQRIH